MSTRIDFARPWLARLLAAAAIPLAVAACGGAGGSSTHGAAGRSRPVVAGRSLPVVAGHSLPAVAGRSLPAGWHTVRLAAGGALPYPPSWRRISGDPGTGSAALLNADGTIRGYLNATPADRNETLASWTSFRLHHNSEDGDAHLRLLASQRNVRLDGGRASCVTDQYTTSRSMYRELACLVAPAHARDRTVLVAAAQPAAWARERSTLEFAINHFVN